MALGEGRILLVANPAAQNGNGAPAAYHARRLLREHYGRDAVTEVQTQAAGDATQIAAEAGDYHSIIALGGDGLVHEIANGMMCIPAHMRPALGVVPVGSGNDYARTLGMSEKVAEAAAQLITAQERSADIGICNGEYFVETLSFGLDAAVALGTMEVRKKTKQTGAVLYLRSGLDQMANHRDVYSYRAEFDGRAEEGQMLLMAIQIGQTYGGGYRICPNAAIDDGVFDICIAHPPLGLAKALTIFLSAKNAHHTRFKQIAFDAASSIHLEFDRRPPVQIDGEPHIASSYDIAILKREIRVLQAV